ncbi:EexN family lipoprotein [Roseomonas chloroacetimidivorans]|uniref:EexN family lipoprotein n=1 Tax=Roseomonas chloroacetimidivorans TaxID=1766656 RepID=UPI003C73A9B7
MKRALLLVLAITAGPAMADPYDVPWFQQNPAARAAWLRRCGDDARLSRSDECANARAAQTRGRLGRPLPSAPTQFERELPSYLRRT